MVVLRIKDPALLQLWPRSQLWLEFDPWPKNFYMPQVWLKKKKGGWGGEGGGGGKCINYMELP